MNYHIENLRAAREFSKILLKEMNELVRSIMLFGSNNYISANKNSDIDLMIVLDNVSVFVTDELREAYRIITKNIANNISDKFHIMTVNLSDLWDMARKGDPVLINILRYGTPLFDRDLLEPMQYLLEIGKIKPTREAVYNYSARAQTLFDETDFHLREAIQNLYYSVVDIVHASLIVKKIIPPSPKDMPSIFKETFKDDKKLMKQYEVIEELYLLVKELEYGKKKIIKGAEYDILKNKVKILIEILKNFIDNKLINIDNEEL